MFDSIYKYFYVLWNQILAVITTANIVDLLDIAVIAFVIFKAIQLIRETRAQQLLKGIALLLAIFILSDWLGMASLSWLMTRVFSYGIIAIAIVFQPELRRALEHMGRTNILFGRGNSQVTSASMENCIDAICKSCQDMQNKRIGALIVFERATPLGEIADTGTTINADVTEPLISNIFYPKSPLHDGGMIISNARVSAAGCILPLTSSEIGKELGTRHRAAVGMSENSDAVVVVVSEETGIISIAEGGAIIRGYNGLTLKQRLKELLVSEEKEDGAKGIIAKIKNIGGGNSNEQK